MLAFRGREIFYYEVELRRLEWKRSRLVAEAGGGGSGAGGEDGGSGGSRPPTSQGFIAAGGGVAGGLAGAEVRASSMAAQPITRELHAAARALDWERKSLAQQLKWCLNEQEREELFRSWAIDPDTKERKLQLVLKLWSRETLG